MKKLYFLSVILCFYSTSNAQVINFVNTNFKNIFLNSSSTIQNAKDLNGNWFSVDANHNGEIELTEALQVSYVNAGCVGCEGTIYQINDLSDVVHFTNLRELFVYGNSLTTLDVSMLPNLTWLWCSENQLTSINISGLTNLKNLTCDDNNLTAIDVAGKTSLERISCSLNQLTSLDLTGLTNLIFLNCSDNQLGTLELNHLVNLLYLHCYNNSQLASLFIKNGMVENTLNFSNNPNLRYICADSNQLNTIQSSINSYGYTNCHVNSYCSFAPGGTFYVLEGNVKYDLNGNGCDNLDYVLPNTKFSMVNGSVTDVFVSDQLGEYYIPFQAGNYSVAPVFENASYFSFSPSSINLSFPSQSSPFTQNFCVSANGVRPDLEVTLLPLNAARPGVNAKYKLVYKNKGNQLQSGSVNVVFDDAILDFVIATPVVSNATGNSLSWNFTDLQPFETREITFDLNLNSPMETPPVNGGDVLNYTAEITSAQTDETPNDNIAVFEQTVVNSFDPNDKTCLEGATIAPSEVGKYVHYLIRFENTGTYPAENIVVKDMIDTAKFDINSLVPINGSHNFYTKITGNKVEFIFENINLPFDDASNDGFVAFKIKTKPTLVAGNSFSNSASIYFDYNFPIVTNTATTTIQALSAQDFEFGQYFSIYPNPVNDVLNIETKQTIEVSSICIYNTLGQLVLVVPNAQNLKAVDVSSLSSGNYFIKINSDKGASNTKFIKQ